MNLTKNKRHLQVGPGFGRGNQHISRIVACMFMIALGLVVAPQNVLASNYASENIDFAPIAIAEIDNVLLEDCDECYQVIDLGFEFTYYGRVYSQIFVSANGFVVVGSSVDFYGGCCHGRDIQETTSQTDTDEEVDADVLAGVIAPWWSNLSMSEPMIDDGEGNLTDATPDIEESTGKVYSQLTGEEGEFVFVVHWQDVRHFYNVVSDERNTFQIQLKQQGNLVEFHYQNIVDNENNIHTVGIESPRQDEGVKVFRTNRSTNLVLPSATQPFALRFNPPEQSTIKSSLRYTAEGNRFKHRFEIDETASSDSDLSPQELILEGGTIAIPDPYDESLALVSLSPVTMTVEFKTEDSLSSEVGGVVSGQYLDFELAGNSYRFDPQSVFIQKNEVVDSDGVVVESVVLNRDATVVAFKTTSEIIDNPEKLTSVADVFVTGVDPDTGSVETHQLTSLSSADQVCGPPYVDTFDLEDSTQSYVYVMCYVTGNDTSAEVYRYDVNSYLDDELSESVVALTDSQSNFSADLEKYGLVVASGDIVAFAKDSGGDDDLQNLGLGTQGNINTTAGVLQSLAISEDGKVVYVLDSTAYYYDGAETALHAGSNSTSIDISADGMLIAFDSDEDITGSNPDGSAEIYSVSANTPFSSYLQKTNLSSGDKACKLPQLSESGARLAVVCDDDLLGLNDFDERQAIFSIDGDEQKQVTHLITGIDTGATDISRMVISDNGGSLSFYEENSFYLIGLSRTSNDAIVAADNAYPVAFDFFAEDTEEAFNQSNSGAMRALLVLLLVVSLTASYRRLRLSFK